MSANVPLKGPYDTYLTLILLALGIYFSVLVARSLSSYLFFRRIRSTALVTAERRTLPT